MTFVSMFVFGRCHDTAVNETTDVLINIIYFGAFVYQSEIRNSSQLKLSNYVVNFRGI